MLYENIYNFHLDDSQPINIEFIEDDVEVSLSMLLGHSTDATISYVNNYKTHGGGTHVQGLYEGIYCSFKKYIKIYFGTANIKYTKKDIINDLNFVISIRTERPLWSGNTKRILSDNRVKAAVKNGVIKSLDKIIESDQSFFNASSVMRMAAFMHVFKSSLKENHPDIERSE